MKKLLLVLFAVMLVLSATVCTVLAETAESTNVEDMSVELNFQADGFLRNISYMGLGMLGIFVVVGVVILITIGLNAATTKK